MNRVKWIKSTETDLMLSNCLRKGFESRWTVPNADDDVKENVLIKFLNAVESDWNRQHGFVPEVELNPITFASCCESNDSRRTKWCKFVCVNNLVMRVWEISVVFAARHSSGHRYRKSFEWDGRIDNIWYTHVLANEGHISSYWSGWLTRIILSFMKVLQWFPLTSLLTRSKTRMQLSSYGLIYQNWPHHVINHSIGWNSKLKFISIAID